jgi:hypothetical protein
VQPFWLVSVITPSSPQDEDRVSCGDERTGAKKRARIALYTSHDSLTLSRLLSGTHSACAGNFVPVHALQGGGGSKDQLQLFYVPRVAFAFAPAYILVSL